MLEKDGKGYKLKYFRRVIGFICSRLLIACCALGLMIIAFYYSMNASNIYVVLKDGMARRAQVIMTGENSDLLPDYFSNAYLESDQDRDLKNALNGINIYRYFYDITGFDHRVSLKWVWNWPWKDTATATVVESIPSVDGKLKTDKKTEAALRSDVPSQPVWRSIRYEVTLNRKNDRWMITRMQVLEIED